MITYYGGKLFLFVFFGIFILSLIIFWGLSFGWSSKLNSVGGISFLVLPLSLIGSSGISFI